MRPTLIYRHPYIRSPLRVVPGRAALAGVLALGLLLAGCSPRPAPAETPPPGPPVTATVEVTPAEPGLLPSPAVRPSQVITLTVWTTEDLAPFGTTSPAASVLARQIGEFYTGHPGVRVQAFVKKPHGQGGLLDFLRTASAAAPSTLPDLMLLDAADLPTAANADLVQPLDEVVGSAADDLFPFARTLGTVNGHLMGMPYIVNVEHLVYDPARFSAPPLTWSTVISDAVPFLFPAGDSNHAGTLLSLYLSLGGTLTGPAGPHLDGGPLTEALSLLDAARQAGVAGTAATQINSADEAWTAYRAGRTALAVASAERYLADRANVASVAAAPLPGRDGPAPALGTAWVWVLVTRDATRGPLAQQLLTHLISEQNLGGLSRTAGRVPARRSALATWAVGNTDPYVPFLQALLEKTVAWPSADVYAAIAPALQRAARDVLLGRETPEAAAILAVRSVGQ